MPARAAAAPRRARRHSPILGHVAAGTRRQAGSGTGARAWLGAPASAAAHYGTVLLNEY